MGSAQTSDTDTLHELMWSTYSPTASTQASRRISQRGDIRPNAPQNLNALQELPAPLLGIALWNVIIGSPDNRTEAVTQNATPGNPLASWKRFAELLRGVLDLDLPSARRLLHERPTDALPPYPDQLIFDVRWKHPPSPVKRHSTATLEICVPRDFRELATIVEPKTWVSCPFFWRRITALPKGTRAAHGFKAELHLPMLGPRTVIARAHTNHTALATQTDFEIIPNDDIPLCKGSIRVQKEEGRPQASRVILQRTIQLPDAVTSDQSQVIRYWLQAEVACLVLQPHGSKNPPRRRTR